MVLSVLCTYFLVTFSGSEDEAVCYQEFSTPFGQRAQVLLADGSTVWRNANSTLRFPEHFTLKQRTADLYG